MYGILAPRKSENLFVFNVYCDVICLENASDFDVRQIENRKYMNGKVRTLDVDYTRTYVE